MSNNILSKYHNALKGNDDLNKKNSDTTENFRKQIKVVSSKYYDLIRELEYKRDEETNALEKKRDKEVATTDQEIAQNKVFLDQIQRTLKMIRLHKEEMKFPEVYQYSHHDEQGNYISDSRKIPYIPFKTLIDDKFNKIFLYVVPNGKPVNKYSLIIRGYTFFHEFIDRFFHRWGRSYISGVHTNSVNLELNIKDAPTKKELEEYAGKQDKRIRDLLPQNFQELIQEYEEAEKLSSQKEWQIIDLEDMKDYYENRYSDGTKTEEYKKVIKELKKLTK
jgi:hypothetical protein